MHYIILSPIQYMTRRYTCILRQ